MSTGLEKAHRSESSAAARAVARRTARRWLTAAYLPLVAVGFTIAQDTAPGESAERTGVLDWRTQTDRPILGFATGPAGLLLSPEEFIEFSRLTDRVARLRFVEKFWFDVAENCPPDENPVRDEFWRRAELANTRFSDGGMPGWMTDRGRVLTMLGEPEKTLDGSASIDGRKYAAKFWIYAPGGDRPSSVMFVREPLRWTIAGIDLAGAESGSATISAVDVPSIEAATTRFATIFRSRGCELTPEQIARSEALAWRRSLWDKAEALAAGQDVPVAVPLVPQVYFFPAREGATFMMFTLPLDESPADGARVVAILRDLNDGELTYVLGTDEFPFALRNAGGRVVAQAARTLPPGRYAVVAGVADPKGKLAVRYSGEQYVARLLEDDLRLTSVILAASLKQVDRASAPQPFTIGGFDVVPRVGETFRSGDELNVFFQVVGASKDASGAADITVTYQLFGKPPNREWVALGQPQPSAQPGAVRVWSLPIGPQFRPAEYKLDITVVDDATGKRVTKELPFRVVAP